MIRPECMVSDYELHLRISNIALANNTVLNKNALNAGEILYRNFEEEEEFALKNDFLENFLNCKIAKAKQLIDKLIKAGVISTIMKPLLGVKSYYCSHYTLAKLPELTLKQIDYLIHYENQNFQSFKKVERNNAVTCFIGNKKHYKEYEERVDRLISLKMKHLESERQLSF